MKKLFLAAALGCVLISSVAFSGWDGARWGSQRWGASSWSVGEWGVSGLSQFYFLLNKLFTDRVSDQPIQVDLDAGRPNDAGTLFGEDEAVIEENGNLSTYGPYTNLITYSEDISDADWQNVGSPAITGTDGFQATAKDDQVFQPVTTIDSTLYTLSFIASVGSGGQTTDYEYRHSDSESGSITNLTLTETPTLYSVTVLGKSGGGVVYFGIEDNNTSDWAKVTITNFQVTETPARMPYIQTVASTVSVPLNYSDADEGYKWPIGDVTPDIDSGNWEVVDGVELVTNGGFDTDTDWIEGSGWTISGGTANAIASTNSLIQTILTAGIAYKITYTISNYTGGSLRCKAGATLGSARTSTGTFTDYLVCTSNEFLALDGVSAFTGSIDNVSVKQIQPSQAWRTCGDNLLDAFDGVADGSELVTDGTFDTACGVNWACDTGWAISGGTANATATTGELQQDNVLEAGKRYEVTFDVLNYSAGSVRIILGTSVTGTARTANGTYTERLTNDAGTRIQVDGFSTFTGSIDNVSVKQISPAQGEMWVDWTPRFGYDDTSADSNIVTWWASDAALYHNTNGRIKLYDGTAIVDIDNNYQADTPYRIKAIYGTHPTEGAGKMQLIVEDKTGATGPWESSVVDFDGSFDPGDYLSIGWENDYWQELGAIKTYKEPKTW